MGRAVGSIGATAASTIAVGRTAAVGRGRGRRVLVAMGSTATMVCVSWVGGAATGTNVDVARGASVGTGVDVGCGVGGANGVDEGNIRTITITVGVGATSSTALTKARDVDAVGAAMEIAGEAWGAWPLGSRLADPIAVAANNVAIAADVTPGIWASGSDKSGNRCVTQRRMRVDL